MTNESYLISELARRAKVSVRTIRYYISEGLLPPPEARGRFSMYDEEYLDRIELIKRLKDAFLPLKEIRRQLETLSKEEIAALVRRPEESTGPAAGQEADDGAKEDAEDPTASNLSPPGDQPGRVRDGGLPNALDYIAGVLKSQPLERIHQIPPTPPAARPSITTGAARPSAEGQPAGVSSETRWIKINILPGLELHANEEAYQRFSRRIQGWIEAIKQSVREELSGGKNV